MNEKRALFWIILLFISNTFAQIKGVVKDSISGKPIPYVSVWVQNENIGTTSEENGEFELKTTKDKMLSFSIVGYNPKTTLLNSKNEIYLSQKTIILDQVNIIKLKSSISLKVGDSEFKRISYLQGKTPQVLAKRFNYDTIYKKTPYLKVIEVFTNSEIKNATIKLRILYHDDKTDLPIIDLVNEDIIVSVKKGRKKTKIDVSKYKIEFPKNGLDIGLESMIIESNKYNDSNSEHDIYAPAIICNYVEPENSFICLKSKWSKIKPMYNERKEKVVVLEPAINLTLTN